MAKLRKAIGIVLFVGTAAAMGRHCHQTVIRRKQIAADFRAGKWLVYAAGCCTPRVCNRIQVAKDRLAKLRVRSASRSRPAAAAARHEDAPVGEEHLPPAVRSACADRA